MTRDPYETRCEAERIIGEDRVPTDVLERLIADYGDETCSKEPSESEQPTQSGAQRFYEASNGAGDTQQFFGEPSKALERATEYAQSEGGFGYVVLRERRRLNDYVGPPIWSEPVTIEEI